VLIGEGVVSEAVVATHVDDTVRAQKPQRMLRTSW